MFNNDYARFFMLLFVVGVAFASEGYLDYGDEAAAASAAAAAAAAAAADDARNLENLREFYRMLLRRNSADNVALAAGIPLEHLMIRKSQRSPSLRLRFGRSGPVISAAVMTRPGDKHQAATAFDDN